MAETAITAVLSKIGELALNEAKVLAQVGEDMMLLRDRLEWLQAFIRDADRKRRGGTDGLTRVWVRQTRDVAFQAEDALDEFFYKVDLKNQGYEGWKMWRAYLMDFRRQVLVRHRLSNQIRKIKSKLNQISENQREYKIEHTPLAALSSCRTVIAAWRWDNYKSSVGFDADVQTLQKMLLDKDERQLMFISIVWESGVGKRTLGKVICSKMIGRFDILIQMAVPPEFTAMRLLKQLRSILEYQCGGDRGYENEDGCIRDLIANRSYLLILSGMVSKPMLNCVWESLPDNNNGSRVMLTLDSEDEDVAWHGNTMNKERINGVHKLSRLNKGRSAQLFCSRAFKIEELHGEKGNMSKYDQVVYDITGGYPLAVVVLAGLLRFKERPGQFEAVLQQLSPAASGMEPAAAGANQALQDGEANMENPRKETQQLNLSTRTTMERVFWPSFEDLRNDLKLCYLYFAAFAKNTAHHADEVVRMWIGEGFVKMHKDKTMEEVGHCYLKELAMRCLVDILEMVDGVITAVKIHPRLHELLHSEVREAGFLDVRDTNDVLVPPSVRRLSFSSSDKYVTTKKLTKLRSFICRVDFELSDDRPCNDLEFLCGSKFLRLIYVKGLKLDALPHGIGGLTELRYLYVSCKDLKELPSSIKGLRNLQTLDIRETAVQMIDPGFWKINTLRHVLAKELTLPGTLDRKELEELQTLHGVKPAAEGEWAQHNCPLRKMTKLRSLKLHGIDHHKHGAALEAALKKMSLLVHLNLKGDVIPSCLFTAEGLQYLETLELDGKVQWPSVSSDLRKNRPNLVEIKMTEMNDEQLEKAGFEFSERHQAYRRSS